MTMKLYGYWRSSASYRLRLALGLKGLDVEHIAVNLKAGAHLKSEHGSLNAQSLVPIIELEDGTRLTQSLAIVEYLEDIYPEPALLPKTPVMRAKVRAAAHIIVADIAPIQNLRVLKFIRAEHGCDDAGVELWAAHWIEKGLRALETVCGTIDTPFFGGSSPGYFECCLIPQIYNARRFGVNMTHFPRLSDLDKALQSHPVFIAALPENQSDAPQV